MQHRRLDGERRRDRLAQVLGSNSHAAESGYVLPAPERGFDDEIFNLPDLVDEDEDLRNGIGTPLCLGAAVRENLLHVWVVVGQGHVDCIRGDDFFNNSGI
jgi:hypothetical protein